jgi:hypothetical protein
MTLRIVIMISLFGVLRRLFTILVITFLIVLRFASNNLQNVQEKELVSNQLKSYRIESNFIWLYRWFAISIQL